MTSNLFKFPLISVVIPTSNSALYLSDAIRSVLNQTYTNWELLIIDNHSSDDTDKILAEFSNLQMNVFKVNNNGTIAISRNIGLDHAKGEWVAFLDSDDYWTKDKLQVCSKYFLQGTDLVYHDLRIFGKNLKLQDKRKIKSRQLKVPVTSDLLLRGNTIATSSVIVRKTAIDSVGGMNEAPELIGTEDYNTWLKISKQTEGFKHVKKVLGFYRLHEENISNMKSYSPPSAAIAEFVGILTRKEHQKLELNFIYTSARLNYLSGKYSEAIIGLNKVIRTRHFQYVLKALWMLSVGRVFITLHKFQKN